LAELRTACHEQLHPQTNPKQVRLALYHLMYNFNQAGGTQCVHRGTKRANTWENDAITTENLRAVGSDNRIQPYAKAGLFDAEKVTYPIVKNSEREWV
jgi:hypothetical protein